MEKQNENMTSNKKYAHIKAFISEFWVDLLLVIVFAFLAFYRLPFVIYETGGTINVSDRVSVEGKQKSGDYFMTYVRVGRANIPLYLLSYVIPSWDRVPVQKVTYTNTDYATTLKIERIQMQNTIDLAKILACSRAECKNTVVGEDHFVVSIEEKANTNISLLDSIVKVDGIAINSLYDIKNQIEKKKVGDKVKIIVKEDDKEIEKYAYVYDNEGAKVIGIALYTSYKYQTTPEINISSKASEAGSSGGLMLTLAVYDILTDENLTKGKKIMGTGTIDSNFNVGEIGGVKHKLLGAKKNKADVFFVPMENLEEAKKVHKKYHMKFELVGVATFDDALEYLKNMK